jgi:hypothetical protein
MREGERERGRKRLGVDRERGGGEGISRKWVEREGERRREEDIEREGKGKQ